MWYLLAGIGIGVLLWSIVTLVALRKKASAEQRKYHESVCRAVHLAYDQPLDAAVRTLAEAGISYQHATFGKECRWILPKSFWVGDFWAGDFWAKAKALITIVTYVNKQNTWDLAFADLATLLAGRAKKDPLAVLVIMARLGEESSNSFMSNLAYRLDCKRTESLRK